MKKFNNDNILLYLQELVGIANKIAIQWYEYYLGIYTYA